MLKKVTFLLAVVALSTGVAAQDKKPVTVADFAGTWNIEMMSHQVALVVEPAEGNKVTATMMMMGRDLPLKGELADRTLTLVGVNSEGTSGAATLSAGPSLADAAAQQAAKPITATLQDDGTLTGEMMTNQGPVKWTGEKLETKKKPQ
ncbi:MAG: hypothetical protein WC829_00040 [Hyphomicrobium sp.]|jgi:hypothetical protein